MLEHLKINPESKVPKYIQLVDTIVDYITSGNAQISDRIPSVKNISDKLGLSRETVFKALNILSEKGIITSSNTKGYFITKVNTSIQHRVFFMLDKMTSFKERIYDGLRFNLDKNSEVDIFFHHGNKKVFRSLIVENINSYTHFVISTFFNEDVSDVLNLIPDGKLILIDQKEHGILTQHSQIYQNFENDIFESLSKVSSEIKKYEEICLVAPLTAPHKTSVMKGFKKYCSFVGTKSSTIDHTEIDEIKKGILYILISEKNDDLVKIIKFCRKNNYNLGKEIGVISYNETQLKEILEGGITVISTDFFKMGQRAAELINNNETGSEENPSEIIIRASI
ncbi:GntR family transcriptional regulator [Flavobacterium sp. FlaQc-48]|uniref:GntR family transcriptional regulator n=1 Tax=Flavobacterium sp. FlaQc-48 TaxID=3374181 RepID=UPI0037581B46